MSGLRRYSVEEKHAMVHWRKKGHSYSEIARTITGISGAKTTASGVKKYLLRHKSTGTIGCTGYQRTFQERRKLSLQALAAVNKYVAADREISALQIQKKLFVHFNIRASVTTISRARRELGWVWTGVKYCQLVREENRRKRVQFCFKVCASLDTFDDVIFTDESTIKCERTTGKCFRRKSEQAPMKPKPKHPFSVSKQCFEKIS